MRGGTAKSRSRPLLVAPNTVIPPVGTVNILPRFYPLSFRDLRRAAKAVPPRPCKVPHKGAMTAGLPGRRHAAAMTGDRCRKICYDEKDGVVKNGRPDRARLSSGHPPRCPPLQQHKEATVQRILLAQAAEGMILAKDVCTPEGRILCGKGTELSGPLLDRLKRMEIPAVTVEGHPVGEPVDPATATAAIERRFSKVAGDPVLDALRLHLVQRIAGDPA